MGIRERWQETAPLEHPGVPSPGVVRAVRRYLVPLMRVLHRPALLGTEQLPTEGPFLLVANHSGGMGLAELMSILATYVGRFGSDRPLAAFVLPVDFHLYPMSALVQAVGAIPATYAAAERTLGDGIPILIFPGSDHEALRPLWQANRVDFGGRLGFLRIARAARIPIVPLGIRGGHFTAPVLFRSRALATLLAVPRLFGVRRWGVSLLGLAGAALIASAPLAWPVRAALIWLWLGSPFVFLPWVPWSLRMRIGAPIPPDALFGPAGTAESDDQLRQALRRVEQAVQALVDG